MTVFSCQDFSLLKSSGPLFEALNFQVEFGDILGITGPNGVGKSLLLKTLAVGVAPHPFRIKGKLVTLKELKSENIFYLPQLHAPDVHLPFLLSEIAAFDGLPRKIYSWFDQRVASRSWNKASGGERMRALLARALNSKAQILLLDEPFNHLDAESISGVRTAMHEFIAGARSRAIIFVSHLEQKADHQIEDEAEISTSDFLDNTRPSLQFQTLNVVPT